MDGEWNNHGGAEARRRIFYQGQCVRTDEKLSLASRVPSENQKLRASEPPWFLSPSV